MDELGLGEVGGIEPGRLALRPADDPAAREVERVGVGGGARRAARETQLGTALAPADVRDQAGRESGEEALGARRGVDDVTGPNAVLVRGARGAPAVRPE